jgi:hypothetical protein
MRSNIVRFYEPPLYTNIVVKTKEKKKMKSFDDTDKAFGLDTSLEKNLQFRREQIQKLLDNLNKSK